MLVPIVTSDESEPKIRRLVKAPQWVVTAREKGDIDFPEWAGLTFWWDMPLMITRSNRPGIRFTVFRGYRDHAQYRCGCACRYLFWCWSTAQGDDVAWKNTSTAEFIRQGEIDICLYTLMGVCREEEKWLKRRGRAILAGINVGRISWVRRHDFKVASLRIYFYVGWIGIRLVPTHKPPPPHHRPLISSR